MRLAYVEILKLVQLRTAKIVMVAAILASATLSALNASSVGAALAAGDAAGMELRGIGQTEALVVVAACAYLGSMVMWQEWQGVPVEAGGGRQSVATRLTVPSSRRWICAKVTSVIVVSSSLMITALVTCAALVQIVMRDYALPLDLALARRTLLYGVLTALLCAGMTLAMRNGLIPTVWFVANSTVISVGYLLALRWEVAWYLPDAVGSALVRVDSDPGMPHSLVAGSVFVAWVVLAWLGGIMREAVSDE